MKIDTGYNTDEPQKPYAKWKKPDAKKKRKKITYDSNYTKCPEWINP